MARTKRVEFNLVAPQARSVALAGTFNDWDPQRTPMKNDGHGLWKARLQLPPGRHEYRFVADGQWVSDPKAEDSVANPHGGDNSVVVV